MTVTFTPTNAEERSVRGTIIDPTSTAQVNSDFQAIGDPTQNVILYTAGSVSQGWLEAVRGINLPTGVVLTSISRNRTAEDGSWKEAQSSVFVPGYNIDTAVSPRLMKQLLPGRVTALVSVDPDVVTAISNVAAAETVTYATETTVADLIDALDAADGSSVTYAVADSEDAAKAGTDALEFGDTLTVTAADGLTAVVYTLIDANTLLSQTTAIIATDPLVVTAIVNTVDSQAISLAAGATVATLLASIGSADITTQAYAVTDAEDTPKTGTTALVTTDLLIVTAENGTMEAIYAITVAAE